MKYEITWIEERREVVEAKDFEEAEEISCNLPEGIILNIKNVKVEEMRCKTISNKELRELDKEVGRDILESEAKRKWYCNSCGKKINKLSYLTGEGLCKSCIN